MGEVIRMGKEETNIECELLSKKEAARFLHCSIPTIDRLLLKKKLTHYKPSGRVFFKKGDLVKYLEAHKKRCA